MTLRLDETETPPEDAPGEPYAGRESHARHAPKPANLKGILWILGVLLVAMPTIALPDRGHWLGVKAFALEVVGIALAVIVVSRGDWTWGRARAALLAVPNIAILLFLAWVGISVARVGGSVLAEYSRFDAMRHLGGGLVYFAVVYGVSARRHLGTVVGLLSLAGSLAALLAFVNWSETRSASIAGAFRNEQLFAGFLLLLMPIILMASQTDEEPWRRVGAQIASVIVIAGILVAQNRSAWFGALAAVALLGVLYLWRVRAGEGPGLQKHQVIVPALMVVLAVGLFFAMTTVGTSLAQRARTITKINQSDSFRWRAGMWDKAMRMARDRPVFGWGVGTFPVQQALYYHPDCPPREQFEIVEEGSSLAENAHNTYAQLAAELGFPGLVLYLGIFAAFFATAIRALPRVRGGFRQALLTGCIAAVGGQMVSAIGSPAWEFAECSLFLWLVLGLGMALAGVGERGRES